jgi:hypothetical protein
MYRKVLETLRLRLEASHTLYVIVLPHPLWNGEQALDISGLLYVIIAPKRQKFTLEV